MVEHVAQLVRAAALYRLLGAEDRVDGGSERFRTIDDKEPLAFRIDAARHDVFKQFFNHRGVFRGSLADAQHMFLSLAVYAHRANHGVVAEQQSVDVDDQQFKVFEPPRSQGPAPAFRAPTPTQLWLRSRKGNRSCKMPAISSHRSVARAAPRPRLPRPRPHVGSPPTWKLPPSRPWWESLPCSCAWRRRASGSAASALPVARRPAWQRRRALPPPGRASLSFATAAARLPACGDRK